jgi:membrane protease YdiL (CAAX protease family)
MVECKAGLKYYLLFLPAGAALALGIGFVTWEPRLPANWFFPLELLANIVGVYAVVALAEELYFRGVLQNLLTARFGRPEVMIVVVGALFGLAHLGRGWRYAAVAAVAGLFYGRAYQQTRSVVASSVTHTLVVITRRFLFA